MLLVGAPDSFRAERRYISNVLLSEFLGLDFALEFADSTTWSIRLADNPHKELKLVDSFFAQAKDTWLKSSSLPKQPLHIWQNPPVGDAVPVIYGRSETGLLDMQENSLTLDLDIFGSAFFMLTRYEEVVKPERDEHDRFPARASLAYQEDFLMRPVVNEYLEILWHCMKRLWSGLERKPRSYSLKLSHDVDVPLLSLPAQPEKIFRNLAADIIKRRNLKLAASRSLSYWGMHQFDLANTFNWLMDVSEVAGVKSAFYFIAGHSAGDIDGHYTLEMPFVQRLLKRIYERGHEIGLHPSYNTYKDAKAIKLELETLQRALAAQGIEQEAFGGRQHYLRWQPETWSHWENAGLSYDSTLGYADQVGFRAGVCYAYPVFNLETRKQLELLEYPLIVMDVTLYADYYMALALDDASNLVRELNQRCKRYRGDFTFLWHNSYLNERWQRQAYANIMKAISV